MINYAEYYVEIYVLSYTVMFGGVLKRCEEPVLAVNSPMVVQCTPTYDRYWVDTDGYSKTGSR